VGGSESADVAAVDQFCGDLFLSQRARKQDTNLTSPVGEVAFHPTADGLLATRSGDNAVRFWNLAAAKPYRQPVTYRSSGSTTLVAFSPDGSLLATASSDGTGHVSEIFLHSPLLEEWKDGRMGGGSSSPILPFFHPSMQSVN